METFQISWLERLDLFRYAILAALSAGIVCPWVGAFLLVRRTSFYGITLPQFATAGVVFGFVLLPWWIAHVGLGGLDVDSAMGDSHLGMIYHLSWAAIFTFGGLITLVLAGRVVGSEIGRVAAAFAIANAATYILGRMSPVGRSLVDELLAGEVLGIGRHEFETLTALFGAVIALLLVFHRDLLLVSYDREWALVLGKRVLRFETLLLSITGLTVAVGTMTLGPTLLFGLLVLPPLAARRWAHSMRGFYALSVALGVASVVGGVIASFELDLPLGAAITAVSALPLIPGPIVGWLKARRGSDARGRVVEAQDAGPATPLAGRSPGDTLPLRRPSRPE